MWTRHDGKRCPGDLRVQQIPGIVARAQVLAAAVRAGRCGWLPQGAVNVVAALARTTLDAPTTPTAPTPDPEELTVTQYDDILSRFNTIEDKIDNARTLLNQQEDRLGNVIAPMEEAVKGIRTILNQQPARIANQQTTQARDAK